jgi:hypothetical protein
MSSARLSSPRFHARLRSRLIAGVTTALSTIGRVIPTRVRSATAARVRTARESAMSTAGMSTAEYAIGTVAACAFAALLYKVVTSTQILDLLTGVVSRALHVPF